MVLKKIVVLLVNIAFLPLILFAQDMERVRENISLLSSKKLKGRGYVGDGDKLAAEYIKSEFENIGLRKFGRDYFQYFVFDVNTFPDKIRLKLDKKRLQPGKDYIANSISLPGTGKGKILRLQENFFNDETAQNKILSGKIKKRVLAYQSKDYEKIAELPQKSIDRLFSAKAILEIKEDKLTAAMSGRQLSNPIFDVLKSSFDSTAKRAKFILDAELRANYLSRNVIAWLEGAVEPDSFIVFTAHYDHLGTMGKKIFFPGANDNASGIAMLMELAYHYALPGNRPRYSVAFIAFSAEEVGLVGSKHYVEHPYFPLSQIKFLVNLDLVGTGDDGVTVVNGTVFKKEFELLTKINQEQKLFPKVMSRGFAANSDHYYFTENGVRSFFIYTLGGIKAYHDIFDKPETLPLTKFKEFFGLLTDFVTALEQFRLLNE